ncbi:MAG TPA: GNAT family N-acetyltransferase [Planctomicrobium sp.]|nr:GNAT family N-acetyltransferase [Planctomicrobium sp.]
MPHNSKSTDGEPIRLFRQHGIEIHQFTSSIMLLQSVGDFLRTHEAENNLVLGICQDIASGKYAHGPPPLLLAIQEQGIPVGVAIMTPPHNLLITRLTDAAINVLIGVLVDEEISVPGISGLTPSAATFAEQWSRRTDQKPRLQFEQRIYSCERVNPVPLAAGHVRPAESRDGALLVEWIRRFSEEIQLRLPPGDLENFVAAGIARTSFFVWENGEPVAMAAASRETGRGIAINYVYTPPQYRGHGYATSCVAMLTQRLLASGKSFCCLYTDLANPTSNSIYQRIGYRPVCDAQMWQFES